MKNHLKKLIAVPALSIFVSGCVTEQPLVQETRTREVMVVEAPPAPRMEVRSTIPSPAHEWIPGHWSRQSDEWVWIDGGWQVRPSGRTVYVPGGWQRRAGGYVWTDGYWR